MPFENGAARSFTIPSIQNNAPDAPGVYGLCNSRQWLLIGYADSIRASLLKHTQGLAGVLPANRPTGFVFEECSGSSRSKRREMLVREYKPILQNDSPR